MSLMIHHSESVEEMFEHAAEDFLKLFELAVKDKGSFNVALAGGSTAKIFFGFLINRLVGHKNLTTIRFFFSDERVVPLNSSDSNAGNAIRLLLKPLSLKAHQLFPLYDEKNSPEVCACNYESLLQKTLPLNDQGVPIFDLICLGIGQDGHIASLFPHSPLLKDVHSQVCATKEEKISYHRITMMPRLINAATHIYVMAFGASKASVIDHIINGPPLPEVLPAQLVMRDVQSSVTLLTADLGDSLS